MSTRSTTKVVDSNVVLLNMYRHGDGYLSGHGIELAEFLKDVRIVNGLTGKDENVANGVDDLAALIVAHFKNGPGGFYLKPYDYEEEYGYTVYVKNGIIHMNVSQWGKTVFDGTPEKFLVQEAVV